MTAGELRIGERRDHGRAHVGAGAALAHDLVGAVDGEPAGRPVEHEDRPVLRIGEERPRLIGTARQRPRIVAESPSGAAL